MYKMSISFIDFIRNYHQTNNENFTESDLLDILYFGTEKSKHPRNRGDTTTILNFDISKFFNVSLGVNQESNICFNTKPTEITRETKFRFNEDDCSTSKYLTILYSFGDFFIDIKFAGDADGELNIVRFLSDIVVYPLHEFNIDLYANSLTEVVSIVTLFKNLFNPEEIPTRLGEYFKNSITTTTNEQLNNNPYIFHNYFANRMENELNSEFVQQTLCDLFEL